MNFLLIFSLAFNVIATLGTTYFVWKIARMDITSSFTWTLKLLACLIQLFQIIWSVFFINDIFEFVSQYPPSTLVFSYSINALRVGLVFAFVARVYYTLKTKFTISV